MRSATFVIDSTADLHPANRVLLDDPAVTRETIEAITLLENRTVVSLATVQAGLDRMAEILTGRTDVRSCTVSGDDRGLAFVCFEPNDTVEKLLTILHTQEIILDPPITFTDDGGHRVTVVGKDAELARAGEVLTDVVAVTLERTGSHRPEQSTTAALLTDRQREILQAAVELGYYEIPREATHADVAEAIDLSAGTVGEHLRKIEARVLPALVR